MGTLSCVGGDGSEKLLKKWIRVFSTFIAITPTQLLFQMYMYANSPGPPTSFIQVQKKISSLLVYVLHKSRN